MRDVELSGLMSQVGGVAIVLRQRIHEGCSWKRGMMKAADEPVRYYCVGKPLSRILRSNVYGLKCASGPTVTVCHHILLYRF